MIILVCSWLRRVGNTSQGVFIYFIQLFSAVNNEYIYCVFLIRAGPSPPLIRAMPERKHFFLREVFPYKMNTSISLNYGDNFENARTL